MPIAKEERVVVPLQPTKVREAVMPPPKPLEVDTKYETRRNLLQYIQGSRWIVTYYKQVLTNEATGEPFNINRPSPYQQYEKIENFEIRVSTPLTVTADSDKSTMLGEGNGIIYPSIYPTYGDTFIADIGDGRKGLFNIKNVTQKSHLRDTAFEIDYDLVNWLDHDTYAAIENCVVATFHYERSYADYGANPKLDMEQHGLYKKLNAWQRSSARHYFDSFFSTEYDTFLIPWQNRIVYDPFIVEFIQKLWSTEDIPDILKLRIYNRDNAYNLHLRTIWDVLLDNDKYALQTAQTKFAMMSTRQFFTGNPGLAGITYSRLEWIYHPYKAFDPTHGLFTLPNLGITQLPSYHQDREVSQPLTLKMTKLPGLGWTPPENNQQAIPDAKKFGTYETYVLSPAFYQQDRKQMSKVERLVMDMLEEKPVDAKTLLPILESSFYWGEVERFYYIPLLTLLARVALGDLSQ